MKERTWSMKGLDLRALLVRVERVEDYFGGTPKICC